MGTQSAAAFTRLPPWSGRHSCRLPSVLPTLNLRTSGEMIADAAPVGCYSYARYWPNCGISNSSCE